MKDRGRCLLVGGLLFLLSVLGLRAASDVLPLSAVKPGMTGKGRSVFQGTAIQEFDVEILGILPNASAKKNIILARLRGQGLENSGVIQGMSGSPVYIDGKLVGAVAYSFPFSKEPIAGLTPIEEMLDIASDTARPPASFVAGASPVKVLTMDQFLALNEDFFRASTGPVDEQGRVMAPVGIPLTFRGFSASAVEKARPLLARLGFSPVNAAAALPAAPEKLVTPDAILHEGDPVAIQLVSGDLDLSGVGTVTHVEGNKVFAFGHPLYNLGSVDYAMAKARILTVIPSLQSSFKVAVPDVLVGRFSQDRSSGAYGEIGSMPKFIPVNVRLEDPSLQKQEFKLNLINDRILGPFFLSQALTALFASAERSVGDLSLTLDGDVYLDDGRSVHLEDLFSGNLDKPVADLSSLVLSVTYFLLNNEFQSLGIHRLDLNIKTEDRPRVCALEQVLLDKYEVSPSEVMTLRLSVRTYRGETLSQEVPLPVPALPPGSEFQLVIGDAATMMQLEQGLYHTTGLMPRSLSQLIRLLNNLRKNNRIYVKVLGSRPGLFLRGEELPNLPLTVKSLFGSPRAATQATELAQSSLTDYQLPLDYVFKGSALIPVRIKK
jgi:hypothetical protein